STQLVTGSFQGLEDCLIQLLRQHEPILTIYVFGSRELAGGRMLAMIPDRFYLPLNSSPEHQMIWPKLIAVSPVVARAPLVCADQPAGGRAVESCGHSLVDCAMADADKERAAAVATLRDSARP